MTPKQVKQLIFALLMIGIAVLFWARLAAFFTDANVGLNQLIQIGISLLVFFVVFLFFSILVEARKIAYPVYLVSIFSFFLFFPVKNYIYLAASAIFFLLLVIAYEIMTREREDRLRLTLRRIWARGLPLVVVGISLSVATCYYFNPLLKIGQEKIEIPVGWIGLAIKPFSGIFGKVLPFYSPEMTIDELLAGGAMLEEGQIQPEAISPELLAKFSEKGLGGLDINELLKNPEIASLLKEEMGAHAKKTDPGLLARQRQEFAKSFGVELKGDETLDMVLAKVLNSKLGEFIGPYAKVISIGIAVALFFFLRLMGIILAWVAMLVAGLLFIILKATKVIRVEKVMKDGETVQI